MFTYRFFPIFWVFLFMNEGPPLSRSCSSACTDVPKGTYCLAKIQKSWYDVTSMGRSYVWRPLQLPDSSHTEGGRFPYDAGKSPSAENNIIEKSLEAYCMSIQFVLPSLFPYGVPGKLVSIKLKRCPVIGLLLPLVIPHASSPTDRPNVPLAWNVVNLIRAHS